ncbi:glycosyltransferase family 2 protein [Noviherbaspirillum massiliense]|uniref:glycosyltransferase family 2 protein n=1 Tax=Noviherbaspirillum massiliense TaxID=1465823 RepID=UPI0002F9DE37|nr:glycosyltransferase family 2 protein [Noviherbaspirillum massiliense]
MWTKTDAERGQRNGQHRLSVVVPVYNEEDNIGPLVEQVHAALTPAHWPWQLILVDDGSRDGTAERLSQAVARYPEHVSAIILQRNFGQTAAMQAGIDAAQGTIIATMDGDLQNNPSDIPRMVDRLLAEDLDLLVGWRHQRQDNLWFRKVPSWLANRLIVAVTGVRLHDYGCSLKVFRASVIRQVRLYGEMHRFIPTWMATVTSPARIKEEPVSHFPRIHGESKYGLSRTFKVMLDLLSVYFFMRFRAKPGHFFGRIGMLFGLAGFLILASLAWAKLVDGEAIGNRPLLLLGALLAVIGVQFISTGIVTEMLARTYFESTGTKTYAVRTVLGDPNDAQHGIPKPEGEVTLQASRQPAPVRGREAG